MQSGLQQTPVSWSFGKKLAFLFFFLFFMLYIFFNPHGVVPLSEYVFDFYIEPFHKLIPWIAKNILGLPKDITVFTNSSGDTTYDYVVVLFIFVVALIVAAIWAVLDRKRNSYNQLYHWLTVVVRYFAAFTMITYGLIKVFKLQFPAPDPWRLLEPFGDASPMGLAWTFMGYSELYNYFTGGAEVLGGLLLLFRRTATLGALVTFGVMGNVMFMNYSYDIPVKLYSSMIVLMSMFLAAKDAKRLYNFFVANKPTTPSDITRPHIRNKFLRISLLVVKALLLVYYLGFGIYNNATALGKYGDRATKAPLFGIYNVETFVRNNDTVPPLQTDTTRWKQMIVSGYHEYSYTHMKHMNDSLSYYEWKLDTAAKKVEMYKWPDSNSRYQLAYHFPDKDHLVMKGTYKNDSVYVKMRLYPLDKFLLVNRGFHWVNESHYNR